MTNTPTCAAGAPNVCVTCGCGDFLEIRSEVLPGRPVPLFFSLGGTR